ncbi:MAG TPA: tetratricopeptide repeat protein [Kofleriaceae bacterium]
MRNLVLCLVAIGATQASADPTYATSMADGARLMAAKDYAGAVAAFRAATSATPGDPRALSELSVAELATGDFAGARVAATEAAWTETHPVLRAMALYNLGRAEEGLGHLGQAVVAYSHSLDLRASSEVKGRLAGLAPATFASRPLAGPFGKPEDFCGSAACDVRPDVDHVVDANGDDVVDLRGNVAHKATPPFSAVALIATDAQTEIPEYPVANLAIEVGSAWYVLPAIGTAASGHGGEFSVDVAMSGPRLVATWTSEAGRFSYTDEAATIVCGMHAGVPRCVGPIVTAESELVDHCGKNTDCTTKPTLEVAFHCAATIHGDSIDITRSRARIENLEEAVQVGPRPDACESLPTFGAHALSF